MIELPITKRVLNVSVSDILEMLLTDLQLKGINYLRVLKPTGRNIQTCCPYHNNGMERRPSAGVSTVNGVFHCFTCHQVSSLPDLINYCFGFEQGNKYGEDWLLDNFVSGASVSRNEILGKALSKLNGVQDKVKYITEQELEKYRFYHPYMYKRKLTDEIIEKFDVGYDKETNSITFPCNDTNGKCLFILRRNVDTKFFSMPPDVDKPVYGLDQITKKEVYVCESVINALTLWSWGYEAVALLGTGTKKQYKTLQVYPIRKYILCFDGDNAGKEATTRFIQNVRNKLIDYYIFPEGKDVNDLTHEEFKKLEKRGI